MARIASTTSKLETVTLELSRDETVSVYALLKIVRNAEVETVKTYTDDVRVALAAALKDDIPLQGFDAFQVFGGVVAPRTESLKYINSLSLQYTSSL